MQLKPTCILLTLLSATFVSTTTYAKSFDLAIGCNKRVRDDGTTFVSEKPFFVKSDGTTMSVDLGLGKYFGRNEYKLQSADSTDVVFTMKGINYSDQGGRIFANVSFNKITKMITFGGAILSPNSQLEDITTFRYTNCLKKGSWHKVG